MKKLLLIILILLPCELGAQEGCGDWVTIWTLEYQNIITHEVQCRQCFFPSDSAECPDSVWVPKPCVAIECNTAWDYPQIISDTLVIPPIQMTIEEKVEMLFDMVLNLTAELEHWKATAKRLWLDEDPASMESREWEKSK